MRVLVIGGRGNFGMRICTRLKQEQGLEVIATTRALRAPGNSPALETATLDISGRGFAADLKSLAPDLVIHCAGPFQGQDYRVALASLACGAHYIDLADGRDFVVGFERAVAPAATAAHRLAVSGASTLPALSSAVIDSLSASIESMCTIDIVIAPGQHAPRGAATMAAVLGYAGRAFAWWCDGKWQQVYGWQDMKRVQFSFGRRWSAACDVPDLELLPSRYPGVRTVTFRAALEVALQHYGLWLIAALSRMGMAIPMHRWSHSFDRAASWLNWLGSDTGGMQVRIAGIDRAGERVTATWELVAKRNHGPEIPCMAAVILANKLYREEPRMHGAKVCMGFLALTDFESEFARWDIATHVDGSR